MVHSSKEKDEVVVLNNANLKRGCRFLLYQMSRDPYNGTSKRHFEEANCRNNECCYCNLMCHNFGTHERPFHGLTFHCKVDLGHSGSLFPYQRSISSGYFSPRKKASADISSFVDAYGMEGYYWSTNANLNAFNLHFQYLFP